MRTPSIDECLKTAAHFHAVLWFAREHPGAQGAEAVEFADANWGGFLSAADVRLGRILDQRHRTPAELAELLAAVETYAPAPTCP